MKIAFFGEDAFSNVVLTSLIDAGHTVVLVVTPQYENVVYKRIEHTCVKYSIEMIRTKQINGSEVERQLTKLAPDLGVVAHFEKLIKSHILIIPKYGFLNIHPSLLPDYRGMSPQHWPLINGECMAGITVHKIDEGIDTGDIVIQRVFELNDQMYVCDLQKIWLEHYKTIMTEAIDHLMQGKELLPQSDLQGRYYGKLKTEQCRIDLSKSTKTVYNLIRGVSLPYQGALYENIRIFVALIGSDTEFEELRTSYPEIGFYRTSPYGAILRMNDGFLRVSKYVEITN